MKSSWMIILSSAAVVAAAFAVAFLGGAHAAKRDAVLAERAILADAR